MRSVLVFIMLKKKGKNVYNTNYYTVSEPRITKLRITEHRITESRIFKRRITEVRKLPNFENDQTLNVTERRKSADKIQFSKSTNLEFTLILLHTVGIVVTKLSFVNNPYLPT
jgi:hypothetical protein